jgi:hypothetical protein
MRIRKGVLRTCKREFGVPRSRDEEYHFFAAESGFELKRAVRKWVTDRGALQFMQEMEMGFGEARRF